jgi:hypothetical protein
MVVLAGWPTECAPACSHRCHAEGYRVGSDANVTPTCALAPGKCADQTLRCRPVIKRSDASNIAEATIGLGIAATQS